MRFPALRRAARTACGARSARSADDLAAWSLFQAHRLRRIDLERAEVHEREPAVGGRSRHRDRVADVLRAVRIADADACRGSPDLAAEIGLEVCAEIGR